MSSVPHPWGRATLGSGIPGGGGGGRGGTGAATSSEAHSEGGGKARLGKNPGLWRGRPAQWVPPDGPAPPAHCGPLPLQSFSGFNLLQTPS